MLSLSLQTVVTAVACILLAILLPKIVQNRYLSPLSKVPGPWLASITGQWLILTDLAGNRTSTIDELHRQYGPVVRIGPKEVSFSNPEVVKEIYGQQTQYPKSAAYDNMSLKPYGIFSMRDRAQHAQRRRLLSHAFSQAVLNDTEPTIDTFLKKLLNRVSKSFGKPVDMLLGFRLLSLDIVGELFLGQSFEALDSRDPPAFLHWMDNNFINMGIAGAFPLLHALLGFLPFAGARALSTAAEKIRSYGELKFNQYIKENGRQSRRRDLLTKIINAQSETGERPLTDLETYTEVGNLVFAGTDTTSTTLTYLFWELAKHPEWQEKLRNELLKANQVKEKMVNIPQYRDIVDLPILEAVMNESLRLHPAAPASLQRSTPTGGRTVNGFFIPEGTTVSMQSWTTQRDSKAFPDPNRWDPERWLSPSKSADLERAKELFMPFSKGPRACLGKSMAVMELKKTTATLVMQARVKVAPSTKDDDMVMIDHFLAIPKGGKCELIFERV